MTQAVLGIAGWKNSGKTTITTLLVTELTSRGLTVSTVKHAHHDADVDHEGTDSFRHRAAGAKEVALVTGRRWVLMHELGQEPEPNLAFILTRLAPVDLVIVEGFKREAIPKIEVRRLESASDTPLSDDPNVIALAADYQVESGRLPFFHLDDVSGLANFVIDRFAFLSRIVKQ